LFIFCHVVHTRFIFSTLLAIGFRWSSPISPESTQAYCPCTLTWLSAYPTIPHPQIIYGEPHDQVPRDVVREVNDQSCNINEGFGDEFVWIVPRFSTDQAQAIPNFIIKILDDQLDGCSDVAMGSGDQYRYVSTSESGQAQHEFKFS